MYHKLNILGGCWIILPLAARLVIVRDFFFVTLPNYLRNFKRNLAELIANSNFLFSNLMERHAFTVNFLWIYNRRTRNVSF